MLKVCTHAKCTIIFVPKGWARVWEKRLIRELQPDINLLIYKHYESN
jgi:hypothetical protein